MCSSEGLSIEIENVEHRDILRNRCGELYEMSLQD